MRYSEDKTIDTTNNTATANPSLPTQTSAVASTHTNIPCSPRDTNLSTSSPQAELTNTGKPAQHATKDNAQAVQSAGKSPNRISTAEKRPKSECSSGSEAEDKKRCKSTQGSASGSSRTVKKTGSSEMEALPTPTKKRFTRKAKENSKDKKPDNELSLVKKRKDEEERMCLVEKTRRREREQRGENRLNTDSEQKMDRKRRNQPREAKKKTAENRSKTDEQADVKTPSSKVKQEVKTEDEEEEEEEVEEKKVKKEVKNEEKVEVKEEKEDEEQEEKTYHTLRDKQLNKVPLSRLKKTLEPFIQDDSCTEVTPKLTKCRECKMTPTQKDKTVPNIFCRFYAFRRLRYNPSRVLTIAGFSEPLDAEADDIDIWMPSLPVIKPSLDISMALYLLKYVSNIFCDLVEQEKEAMSLVSPDTSVTWKRAVSGVREMCDVCNTTLFNLHWVCHRCGFVVCIDCYKLRMKAGVSCSAPGCTSCDEDGDHWLKCSVNRQTHKVDEMLLTQIIPSDALWVIGRQLHEVREKWNQLEDDCACKKPRPRGGRVKVNGISKMRAVITKVMDKDQKNRSVSMNGGGDGCPLSMLADVASNREDAAQMRELKARLDGGDESMTSLREFLTRSARAGKLALSPENSDVKKGAKTTQSMSASIDDIIKQVVERKGSDMKGAVSPPMKHYVPRVGTAMQGRSLPVLARTLTETSVLFPDVPHSWLDNGRLLRLHDPLNKGNLELFQQQWQKGQPVIIGNVHKGLTHEMWTPRSFGRDFGDLDADFVNCGNGCVLVGHNQKEFWDGFESVQCRLCDGDGKPMILKLKDWPTTEDFSDLMPKRFEELSATLPLPEYTHRTGVYNLASRLPDFFVKPDLGPKMYIAYGSVKVGSTNLHMDMSDAVNIVVYIGMPRDDTFDHKEAVLAAMKEADACDLTIARLQHGHEKPGALWHIFDSLDADKIRDFLNKVAVEKGEKIDSFHDPIHDQSWYLNKPLRARLKAEYGVTAYTIVQYLGDSVMIPAGNPHQVQNFHSCIKVAEDFVSPENLAHCFKITQDFRHLSDSHTNHEDKLQIKNTIYHAVKDTVAVLKDTDP